MALRCVICPDSGATGNVIFFSVDMADRVQQAFVHSTLKAFLF